MAKAKTLIRTLQDLVDHFGALDAYNLNRRIYKDTDCGASISVRRKDDGLWLHNGQDSKYWYALTEIDAFTIQTIVEGSDATVDSDEFILPVKATDVDKWIVEMEAEASRLWEEANMDEIETTHSYRIECGNSNTGAIGAVAYVEAISPVEARQKLMDAISGEGEELKLDEDVTVRVYFGPKKWGKAEECD